MKRWLRRLRGALGIGTLWGAAGAAVGSVVSAAVALVTGLPLGYAVPMFTAYVAATTFLLGAGFALTLAASDARGSLGKPTTRRFAALGALAGAALPFLWLLAPVGEMLRDLTALPTGQFIAAFLMASASCAAVGSGMAAATLSAANRSPGEIGTPDDSAHLGPDESGLGDTALLAADPGSGA